MAGWNLKIGGLERSTISLSGQTLRLATTRAIDFDVPVGNGSSASILDHNANFKINSSGWSWLVSGAASMKE